jgi:autotransporter-associated beta strand protein
MNKPTNIIKKALSFIAAVFITAAASDAQAVVFLWNNTGTNWTSPTSWTNGVQPASTSSSSTTDEIQFGNVGANNNTVILTSTRAAQNITFLTNANTYNINSFNGSQTLSSRAGITNNSTATQTFNILVENANNNTWFQTAGGSLVFNNVASLTTASSGTSRTLTLAGDGSFTFNNELKQGGTSTAGKVLYTGNGSVTFNGTNTLGGWFEIKGGGTVNVNGGTGLGTGLITISAATGTTNGPKLIINTTNGLSVANSFKGSSSLSTMATLDLLAGNDTNAVMTFVVNQYQGNNMSFTNHGIGKTLLQFTNVANTLTSSTDTSGGRRLINNSANLTVQFDGTLDIGSTTADVNTVGGAGDFIFRGSLFNTSSVLRGLNKTGTGTVTLQAVNTYNGDTTVQEGKLVVNGSVGNVMVNSLGTLGGSGTLGAVTLNGGTVAPGNSPGLLTMASLDASNGSFIFQIGAPTTRGITYDAINITNLFTLGTNTAFTFETLDNYAFADGNTYDLFDWGSVDMTNFNVSVLEAALPSLASTPDLSWNVSQFTLDGSVSVSIIPEPTALELITMPWQALKALCRMQAEFAEQNPVIATMQTGI